MNDSKLIGYGRNQRFLCVDLHDLHPRPMVTPVHRFQSIESVANNGLRYTRSPGYNSNRYPTHYQPTIHYNGSTSSIRNAQRQRSVEMLAGRPNQTPTPRRNNAPKTKIKYGVWIFFVFISFFLATCKYYFHGVNIGLEAFAFCSLLVIILAIGGLVSLYEAITATANNPENTITLSDNTPDEETNNQVPTSIPPTTTELPPPPYHIAIMLPSHNDAESIQVIRDSPPPSYEKAVT